MATPIKIADVISWLQSVSSRLKKSYRFHKLLFTSPPPWDCVGNASCRSKRGRIWTLWYRPYRSYPAAGKLCYRLCQRVSVPRCTLRRHYARFICLVTFLLFYMSCDPTGAHDSFLFPPRVRLPLLSTRTSLCTGSRLCHVDTRRRSKFKRGYNRAISPWNVEWKFCFRRILLGGRLIIFWKRGRDWKPNFSRCLGSKASVERALRAVCVKAAKNSRAFRTFFNAWNR